ncbi:glycoside hydrolase family 35 [Massilia forsythiae]|uniref:Beta-galactosidase n=1 Tax=Massilia forsythiae TaxID=2728020 RepID=A0A7Z2ZTY6_9BURK|nr:beta-galactosidase [Massilia forsythiae]QJE01854.1 glycoside hydrolase family 35 [Massilia forsythiae]
MYPSFRPATRRTVRRTACVTAICLATALLCHAAHAERLLTIDASAPAATPLMNTIQTGTARSPDGHVLGINSQYLTRDGQPWLPVMGEFHYSRVPAASWEAELAKMKTAGIDIVAFYVIWNHHEANEGRFDWSGNRDLRRFVQLAQQAGLQVVVRVGPWAHAEVRYGGVPDWVVDAMPTRRDDPQYLGYVARFYNEIGRQLDGLLWKQGGPVIGAQIENEYNLAGPGRGAGHIRTLKGLVLKAGIDVPYYTVTGWDQTLYPSGEVTPVFGSYPDEPWGTSTRELPPKETYAFRFDSRVSGDLGAQTHATQQGTAETDMTRTPFLGAEYGAGLPAMYRRRTLVSPDDIAAMLPVQLGSGVNLMGYYMFHGGRNPVMGTTMEESTRTGGYNDTPAINYDFNAPLGPDGQQRPVLAWLRPFHFLLHDFGARLAPMTVRKPDVAPRAPDDLATPRLSVRSRGDAAFLFYNGHVRQYPTPAQKDVRFTVKLPGGAVTLPRKPVDLASGSYFIWPVNFDMDGHRLRYATAQPVARLDGAGGQGSVYVFAAQAGVPVEFAFGASARDCVHAGTGAHVDNAGGQLTVDGIRPGLDAALTLACAGKQPVTVLVLAQDQARQLIVGDIQGRRRLVLSDSQAYVENGRLVLRSLGQPNFRAAVYPALDQPAATGGAALRSSGRDGLFQVLEASVPARSTTVTMRQVRAAQPAAPVRIGGTAKAALLPDPESFGASAAWELAFGGDRPGADDLLDIDFSGDVARLFDGTRMVDDWYYNGQRWQFGLGNLGASRFGPLMLTVLPLRADAPIYLPREHRPAFGGQAQVAALRKVQVVPAYRLEIGR